MGVRFKKTNSDKLHEFYQFSVGNGGLIVLYFIYQKQKPIRLSAESRLDGPNRVLVFDIMCFNLRSFLMWGDVFFHFHPIKFRNGITDNSVLYLKKWQIV